MTDPSTQDYRDSANLMTHHAEWLHRHGYDGAGCHLAADRLAHAATLHATLEETQRSRDSLMAGWKEDNARLVVYEAEVATLREARDKAYEQSNHFEQAATAFENDLEKEAAITNGLRAELAALREAHARLIKLIPTLPCRDDCDGVEQLATICYGCHDCNLADIDRLARERGEARADERRQYTASSMMNLERAESAERQLAEALKERDRLQSVRNLLVKDSVEDLRQLREAERQIAAVRQWATSPPSGWREDNFGDKAKADVLALLPPATGSTEETPTNLYSECDCVPFIEMDGEVCHQKHCRMLKPATGRTHETRRD